jgi:hypothetical protein
MIRAIVVARIATCGLPLALLKRPAAEALERVESHRHGLRGLCRVRCECMGAQTAVKRGDLPPTTPVPRHVAPASEASLTADRVVKSNDTVFEV